VEEKIPLPVVVRMNKGMRKREAVWLLRELWAIRVLSVDATIKIYPIATCILSRATHFLLLLSIKQE
jgi:hypothetical protein